MLLTVLALICGYLAPLAVGQGCPPEGVYYYPDNAYCDRYTSCRDGLASAPLMCADGLLFDDLVLEGGKPCEYPNRVDCGSRTKIQPAQPSGNCLHQWGYFGSGSTADCGVFFNCVEGRESLFTCPEGLAFSSITYRCEYPEDAPGCDVQQFYGFLCPAKRAFSGPHGFVRHTSPRSCREYFICADTTRGGAPRLQSCIIGHVFNSLTQDCDEPENVLGCEGFYPPAELQAIRAQKAREAARLEQQLLARIALKASLAKRRQA